MAGTLRPEAKHAFVVALAHSPRIAAAGWFVALATTVLVGAVGAMKPLHNWDMISYVAAAYASEGLAGRELSDRVYADVAAEVGPDAFSTLVEGEYRATVHRDPESLRQQLPITRIRVVYVALVRLAHAAGATYPQATYLVSAVAAAVSVILLSLICRSLGLSLLLVPLVVLWGGYIRLARLSTPDAITCLVALLVVWLLLTKRPLAYAVAALLPLFRSDFVLLSVLLAAFGWLDGRRVVALVSALTGVALYLGLNAAFGGYGWRTLVNVTFIVGAHPYPETMAVVPGIEPYLRAYWRGVGTILRHHHILVYAGVFLLFWSRAGRQAMPREQLAALGVMAAFMAGHWLLFPVYGERFFSSAASTVLLVALAHLSRVWPLSGGSDPVQVRAARAV